MRQYVNGAKQEWGDTWCNGAGMSAHDAFDLALKSVEEKAMNVVACNYCSRTNEFIYTTRGLSVFYVSCDVGVIQEIEEAK